MIGTLGSAKPRTPAIVPKYYNRKGARINGGPHGGQNQEGLTYVVKPSVFLHEEDKVLDILKRCGRHGGGRGHNCQAGVGGTHPESLGET